MSGLRIARGFTLPLDVAGEATAILAKRGAGKTNTATVLVEELVRAGVQTVILDPVGAWWGVRAGADGEAAGGLGVPILGGRHADVPLEPTAGALIAQVAVESGQSLLLDLSDFGTKALIGSFVTAFAEKLYALKGRADSLVHLVLEEADLFAPQKVKGSERMQGAIEQLVRRGRSRGIGITMISQRSAVLSKDVLTQADVLVVMRTTGPHDVRAIREWVAARGDEQGAEVIGSLPALATGEAWFWNPERELLRRVQVRARSTFDSSRTPKVGEIRVEPESVAPINLDDLGEQIQATVEKVKADDPRELKKTIAGLRRELAAKPSGETVEVERVVEKRVEVPIEVPAVSDEQVAELRETANTMRDLSRTLVARADQIEEALRHVREAPARPPSREHVQRDTRHARPDRAASRPVTARPSPPDAPAGDVRVSGPQQRILDALAWFESIGVKPRRPPLAAVAGTSSKSSGFEKNISTLRTAGLIEYPEPGRVELTDAGRQAAVWPDETPTDVELQEAIYRMVSGPQAALLRVLVDAYPDGLTREELAERAGASVLSSGFEKNVSTLKSFELVTYPVRGEVAALPVLFVEEPAHL